MKRVHSGLETKEFVESEFVTHRYYCKSTGLLATDACESVAEGWYKTNYSLPAVCTSHPGNVLHEVGYVPETPPEETPGGDNGGQGTTTSSETSGSASSDTSSTGNESSKPDDTTSSTEQTTSEPSAGNDTTTE